MKKLYDSPAISVVAFSPAENIAEVSGIVTPETGIEDE